MSETKPKSETLDEGISSPGVVATETTAETECVSGSSIDFGSSTGEWRQVVTRHQQTGSPPLDSPALVPQQELGIPRIAHEVREQQPARRTNCGICQGLNLKRKKKIEEFLTLKNSMKLSIHIFFLISTFFISTLG